jgi:hypothetical protein
MPAASMTDEMLNGAFCGRSVGDAKWVAAKGTVAAGW